jgi:hypothetical protein
MRKLTVPDTLALMEALHLLNGKKVKEVQEPLLS